MLASKIHLGVRGTRHSQRGLLFVVFMPAALATGSNTPDDPVRTAQRFVPRPGSYRLTDDVQEYKSGDDYKPGWDEPGTDEPVEAAVYYLRNFSVR